jgi:hypothetical protein
MKEFLSIPMSYAGGTYWTTAAFTPTAGNIYYYTPDTGTTYYACICTAYGGNQTAGTIPTATSGTFTSGAGNAFYVMGIVPRLLAATTAWSATAYNLGDYVTTASKLYVCGEAGTASAAPTTTTKGVLDGTGAKFYYVSASILTTSNNAIPLTGTAWTTALDLYVGDIVYYGQDVYAVINTTAASTATAAKLPVPSPTSQYYRYLYTIGGQGLIGLEDITTVEILSPSILVINTYNNTARITKLFFQSGDDNYAPHYAVMQAISNAFNSRKNNGISSTKLSALPPAIGKANPNWVATVIYS